MEHKFKADELFDLIEDTKSVFPLNLEFVPKKNLASKLNNSGIYFLTYKGELIYIGYAIKEDAVSRMKKQLEGITLRGKNLAFNDSCQEIIKKSNILNPFFSDAILAQKKSVETSPKRILFAENHWKDFAFLDETILRNFIFHWFPLDSDVAKKCDGLKQQLRPRCNKEGVLPSEYENILKSIN
jgi:hypothetical protein